MQQGHHLDQQVNLPFHNNTKSYIKTSSANNTPLEHDAIIRYQPSGIVHEKGVHHESNEREVDVVQTHVPEVHHSQHLLHPGTHLVETAVQLERAQALAVLYRELSCKENDQISKTQSQFCT